MVVVLPLLYTRLTIVWRHVVSPVGDKVVPCDFITKLQQAMQIYVGRTNMLT